MKLGDLNKNNIDLGHSRTVEGDSFEFAVPMSFRQTDKANIDGFDDEEDDEFDDNLDHDKLVDLLHIAKSWAPKRNLPDMRRVPNTANVV